MQSPDDLLRACKTLKRGPEWNTAMGLLLKAVYPHLLRYIFPFCRQEADARDILQTAAERMVRKFKTLDGETFEKFLGWARRITLRVMFSAGRRQAARREDLMCPEELEKELDARTKEFTHPGVFIDLQRAYFVIQSLESPCFEYLVLRFLYGYSYKEIGQFFGKQTANVGKKTRDCLEEAIKRFEPKRL